MKAAPDPLDGLPIRFSLPIGFGLRVGIAGRGRTRPAVPPLGPLPRPEHALNNPKAFERPEVADWWTALRGFARKVGGK